MEIGSPPPALFAAASAETFFGPGDGEAVIAAAQSGASGTDPASARAIVTAHKREINRIRGFKLELTPAENQKLAELQAKIVEIGNKALEGTARPKELEDRLEMLREADRIIGKPIVDVGEEINRVQTDKLKLTSTENARLSELRGNITEIDQKTAAGTATADDVTNRLELVKEAEQIIGRPLADLEADEKRAEKLGELNALRVAIIEPKLDTVTAKRVAFLERFSDSIKEQIISSPDRKSLKQKFSTVAQLVDKLKPLRQTSQLSKAERAVYDDTVALINEHVGAKVELTTQESDRVASLEASIAQFQAFVGEDLSQQPTPQAVARAYTSLAFS